jgi:hypothetical protein
MLKSNLFYVIFIPEYDMKDKINMVISFNIMLDVMPWRQFWLL